MGTFRSTFKPQYARVGRGPGRIFTERELGGVGVVLSAHEACYVLWREESRARLAFPMPGLNFS